MKCMTFDQICRFLDTHLVLPKNYTQNPKTDPNVWYCVKCLISDLDLGRPVPDSEDQTRIQKSKFLQIEANIIVSIIFPIFGGWLTSHSMEYREAGNRTRTYNVRTIFSFLEVS